ncbi:hypothetical protein AAFF_G00066350 [Aldrovandia affinis]|uniref:Peptidase M1 leukotriene A4 hydrolase/aminopeptidase C-terminal domain-containing protein n=1 Tax=Aldrovandia affinis TaxID=143900 RepID=A0AAD7T589_9TELE|nr:hypothetical protein AAFF_G00066350 [Aldrovandia affinis]
MDPNLNPNPSPDLDPSRDDLPLRANTSHMLVKHFVLDLTVHFSDEVIRGSVVLFLAPGKGAGPVPSPSPVGQETERPTSDSAGDNVVGGGGGHCRGDQGVGSGEEAAWEDGGQGDFVLVLDCCTLAVLGVEEVDVASVLGTGPLGGGVALVCRLVSMPSSHSPEQQDLYSRCSHAPAPPGGDRLQIRYHTKPEGASVRWTKDQSGRSCVYTQGSPINNRALFPCQEPPVAMSTWQARVRAPSDCVVLLSGENEAKPFTEETGLSRWDYYVTMPMPASTFTIAVGHWVEAKAPSASSTETNPSPATGAVGMDQSKPGSLELKLPQGGDPRSPSVIQKLCSVVDCSGLANEEQPLHSGIDCSGLANEEQPLHSGIDCSGLANEEQTVHSEVDCSGLTDSEPCCHGDYPCRYADPTARAQDVIPHRVFAPPSLQQRAESTLLPLLPRCLAAAHFLLGVHPFPRLDVLVVPPGFSSLGMASPHMVYLSQSVLSGDAALCGSRLCHEIAHSWFGLAIGARDWTEEWISEGFATYLEDVFWARAQQRSQNEEEEERKLKAVLRWRRLRDELHNSEEELQILRPSGESTGEVSESGASVVRHGLNPEKPFMQVHYLKGYFLLRFLAGKIGEERFLRFFRLFVSKYHGQLILSQDFLQMLLGHFPDAQRRGLTLEAVYADWLDRPGIPETLQGGNEGWLRSSLEEEVKEEVVKWIDFGGGSGRAAKRRRVGPKVNSKELTPDQLVLLLELLLEEAVLSVTSLRTLERTHGLRGRDAEVRHRWCELVIKYKHAAAYGDVERFLMEDQAMGVYLYGELMVNEDAHQQALARRCFSRVQGDMDPSTRRVVEEMIL